MQAVITMTRNVLVVPPELSLGAAHRIMRRERIRHLPVVQGGVLLGMLSDRDVLLRAKLGEDGTVDVPQLPVAVAMTPDPITCHATTSVAELVAIMTERKIDAVVVVGPSERLIGLVTSTDLLLLLGGRDEARPLPFAFEIQERGADA